MGKDVKRSKSPVSKEDGIWGKVMGISVDHGAERLELIFLGTVLDEGIGIVPGIQVIKGSDVHDIISLQGRVIDMVFLIGIVTEKKCVHDVSGKDTEAVRGICGMNISFTWKTRKWYC